MKKLLFIFVIVLSFISCAKENNKHVYFVSFSFPSTSMLPTGNAYHSESKMKTEYLGIANDSILNVWIEEKRSEFECDSERWLKKYDSLSPNICNHNMLSYKSSKDYIENTTEEVKSTAEMSFLRSNIGQYAIVVVLSDSLLNSVDGDYEKILKDYDKTYRELCQVYEIYDGVELASTLENEYLNTWYCKEYGIDY